MPKKALVVPRHIILGNNSFQGFLPIVQRNLASIILKHHRYEPRGEILEKDSSLKQIIPYIWIVNPSSKKVFLYQRGSHDIPEGEHIESRYLGKYSGGVGGHIDEDTESGSKDPITAGMMRELREEVEMEHYPTPKYHGYLNDDSDEIGKVHFGIIAIVETSLPVRAKVEEGLLSGKFYTLDEVQGLIDDPKVVVENWTKMSWPYVKNYLSK